MRLIVAIALTLAFITNASAQTACKYITDKAVLTATQWNWCFQQKQDGLGFSAVNKAGDVMLGRLVTAPPSGSVSGLNLTPGTAPLAPADGDIWATTGGLYVRINGATVGPVNSSAVGANPTATAGPSAINGSASTFMRSDAAPAVQSGTNAVQGIVRGDGTTISCTAGVCTANNVTLPTPTRAGDIIYWNGSAWVTIAGNNSGTGILAENATGVPSFFKPATLQSTVFSNTSTTSATAVMGGFGSGCTMTPTLTGRVTISFTGWGNINTSTASLNYQLRYGTGTAPVAGAAASGTTVGGALILNVTSPNVGTVSANGTITGLTPGTAYWFDISYYVGANTGTLGQISCNGHEF
jgi:hypothetical protein